MLPDRPYCETCGDKAPDDAVPLLRWLGKASHDGGNPGRWYLYCKKCVRIAKILNVSK